MDVKINITHVLSCKDDGGCLTYAKWTQAGCTDQVCVSVYVSVY